MGDVSSEIITLNVGGTRFSTSVNTLTWVPDTFFTSLLSKRIPTVRDETGAIFIDRDPEAFRVILNYLRSRQLDLGSLPISTLKHEAQYYNITPLARRLSMCEDLEDQSCGNVLFEGILYPSTSQEKLTTEKQSRRVNVVSVYQNMLAVARDDATSFYVQQNQMWKEFVRHVLPARVVHIALYFKPDAGSCNEQFYGLALANNDIMFYKVYETTSGLQQQPPEIFRFGATVDHLFFVGNNLVALSKMGRIGVYQCNNGTWQEKELVPISCYETAGTSLFLGCTTGVLYYIDMQKFPLRMRDNDILLTELFRDPENEWITAVSVYLTPKTNVTGNWIEICYGTKSGAVHIIVQHPETRGHGPKHWQSFKVHTSPIIKVALKQNHLISVCARQNHVRSWAVTRFRGMISTRPGLASLAAFTSPTFFDSVEQADSMIGLYGGKCDTDVLLVHQPISGGNKLFIRYASNGARICSIETVNGAPISTFSVVCDPRWCIIVGTVCGSIQIFDLSTAMELETGQRSLTYPQLSGPSFAERETVTRPVYPAIRSSSLCNQPCPTPQELLQLMYEPDRDYNGYEMKIEQDRGYNGYEPNGTNQAQ